MTQPGNFFSGDYLDRRAEQRSEEQWLASAEADPATCYIAMQGTTALMDGAGAAASIAFLQADDPRVAAVAPQRRVLLGWFRGVRCVLLEFDTAQAPADWLAGYPQQHFAELRPLASNLDPEAAGLLAYARALTIWRSNHQHCGRCGHHTFATRAGHARRCSACHHESFPRIDPAIIVLVHNQGRALLGRQPGWPPGRYSTIAGFVEPGESLEDAVRREVREETGIIVRAVHYHSSQPWPFPQALMLGFIAEGEDGEPQLHDQELEDARWFTREQVLAGQILLPPAESISRRLVEHWLHSS
jgi:NAD+ diphosphatase